MNFTKTDWSALKKEFEPAGNSPLSYAAAVVNLTEHLLDQLDDYERESAEVIAEINSLRFTEEFNFALPNLISKTRAKIKKIRQQAVSLREELLAADDLYLLSEIESRRHPSFELTADVLVETTRAVLAPVEFYKQYAEFVQNAAAFYHQSLYANRQYAGYDTPRYDNSLSSFFNYVREGHLLRKLDKNSTVADYVLNELTNFRNRLNELYRKPLESSRRESLAPALIAEFRKNIGGIASALKNSEERQWLIDWANNLN